MVKSCRNVLFDGDRVVSAARKLSRARKVQLLLRAVALLQLQQLCKTWEDAEHVNHSVYDIRRLSSLQHEGMKQAFAPLHSGLCATCGRLLGRNVGSDEYVLEPQRGKNIPCSQYSQVCCCGPNRDYVNSVQKSSRSERTVSSVSDSVGATCRFGFSTRPRLGSGSIVLIVLRGWEEKCEKRVPMRNSLELLRTRIYTDKLRADLYVALAEDLTWLPPMPEMSSEQVRLYVRQQMMMYVATKKDV